MAIPKGLEIVDGVTTSWLPLTTLGNTAGLSACSRALYYVPSQNSVIVAFDPYYGKWLNASVKCLAAEQTLWWNQHSDAKTIDINLGPFNCPAGYTTATTSAVDSLTTAVGCCPSQYAYQGAFFPAASVGQCASDVGIGTAITALAPQTGDGFIWTTKIATITTPFQVVGAHFNGFIFQDSPATPTSQPIAPASNVASPTENKPASPSTTSGSNGSSRSTASTGSRSMSQNPTAPTPNVTSGSVSGGTNSALANSAFSDNVSKGKSGLSSGATIGISIAAAFAVVIICFVVAYFLLRRRRRAKNAILASPKGHDDSKHPYGPPHERMPYHYPVAPIAFVEAGHQHQSMALVEVGHQDEKLPRKEPVEMWAQHSPGR